MDATSYQALLQQLAGVEAPPTPMFTPEQVQQRTQQNNALMGLALRGQLSSDPRFNAVGGSVLKQALQGRSPRITAQGELNPLTGEFAESPEFRQLQNDARKDRILRLTLGFEDQRTRAQERSDRQNEAMQMRTDMAQQQRDFISSQNAMNRQNRLDAASLRAGDRADRASQVQQQNLEKGVTKYSTTLEKAGVPEFSQALQLAEGTLSQHKPGTLPGYGRVLGAVPNFALSADGQITRSNMQEAANILLKSRSGAARTDTDMRRFLTEVATGAGMTEEAMRNGWRNVRHAFDEKVKNLRAGASPEVIGEYTERGGTDYQPQQTTPQIGATPALQLPPGFKLIGPAQ